MQTIFDRKNSQRLNFYEILERSLDEIVQNKLTEDNIKEIMGEDAEYLIPREFTNFKFKIKLTYKHCFNMINEKFYNIYCYLVSGKAN